MSAPISERSCAACGHENRADARFCSRCGAGFPQCCSGCARELPGALEPLHQRQAERGRAFRMRIGIHTGLVVVGKIGDDLRMDYTPQESRELVERLARGLTDRGLRMRFGSLGEALVVDPLGAYR